VWCGLLSLKKVKCGVVWFGSFGLALGVVWCGLVNLETRQVWCGVVWQNISKKVWCGVASQTPNYVNLITFPVKTIILLCQGSKIAFT
jgi:hypothetical protein